MSKPPVLSFLFDPNPTKNNKNNNTVEPYSPGKVIDEAYFKKRAKIADIVNSIKDSDPESGSKTSKRTTVALREFTEWSLLTKFDGFSKIFEYRKWYSKLIWILLFATFTGFTTWLVVKNITDYYTHEVNSKIEVITERPTLFPAVTVCDNDAFTSVNAQTLIQNITLLNYGVDLDNMTFSTAYVNSKTINKLAKMYVNSNEYTDDERLSLMFAFFINECYYAGEDCLGDFTWYFSYEYGNCYQFNTGRTVKKSTTEGVDYGLALILGPIINKNRYVKRKRIYFNRRLNEGSKYSFAIFRGC